ncbi:MAG: PilZ domain-containing protein, partial [Terriglobales bacterium]
NRAVYDHVKDLVPIVSLGFVKVKGLETDVEIFGIPDLPDHRRHPRVPLEIEMLYVLDGGMREAATLDISASGVSFRAVGDFELGMLVPIKVRLRSTLQWLDLDSRVRTLHDGMVGVEFDKLTDAEAKALAALTLFKSN